MELQAIALTELSPGPALLAAGGVIVDTQFGRAWAPGALALVVGVVLAAASRYRAPPLRWFALIAAVVVVSHACAGHAGANGRVWPVLVMSLHLLSMGAWSGAVFAAATTVLRADVDAADGARYAIRLSMLASAALAGIVLTGISSAWHGLGGTLEPLMPATATTWGVVLDVKLGGGRRRAGRLQSRRRDAGAPGEARFANPMASLHRRLEAGGRRAAGRARGGCAAGQRRAAGRVITMRRRPWTGSRRA
jgi:hypothetical protein